MDFNLIAAFWNPWKHSQRNCGSWGTNGRVNTTILVVITRRWGVYLVRILEYGIFCNNNWKGKCFRTNPSIRDDQLAQEPSWKAILDCFQKHYVSSFLIRMREMIRTKWSEMALCKKWRINFLGSAVDKNVWA